MNRRAHRRRIRWLASVATLAAPLIVAGGASATVRKGTDQRSAAAVLEWSEIAESTVAAGRGAGPAQVLMATVEVAIHDTVVAVDHRSEPFHAVVAVDGAASLNAAVATAAHDVLVARLPQQTSELDRRYRDYLDSLPDDDAKAVGVVLGARVAELVVVDRSNDGLNAEMPYHQPAPAPGTFEPVADSAPAGVGHGLVTPFALSAPEQFRPNGPDELVSPEYAADFAEVRDLGRLDSVLRSDEQTETALFWSDNGFLQWSRTLRAIAAERQLDAFGAARLLAMTHVAAADAGIACFEAKYHYMSWRPVHGIQRADTDDNAATDADATWQAQITANHPEYPAGATCVDAAITATVAHFFGTDELTFEVTSNVTETTRHYERLSDSLAEIVDARVWSGLHFRNSTEEGAELGADVARYVIDTQFQAEPNIPVTRGYRETASPG